MQRLLLIELNEVNLDVLLNVSDKFACIKRLVKFPRTETFTLDEYDGGYLEPWVQWVSVHAGKPSSIHGIKHLGDIPSLSFPQLWETLGDHGIHSGVWGIMNGSRRGCQQCDFFVADPWTFSETSYPDELDKVMGLSRYIAKNYLNLSPFSLMEKSWHYGLTLLRIIGLRQMLIASNLLLEGLLKFGVRNMVLGTFFEYTAAIAFLRYKAKYRPRFTILFFNLLAHLQHHYWSDTENLSVELLFGLKAIDMALAEVLAALEADEVVLVANALSQCNTLSETPWIQYRQHDQASFLRQMNIGFERVEALMTHDAHVFFSSEKERDRAFTMLEKATIKDEPLFYVEQDLSNEKKLFYRLQFTGATTEEDFFTIDGRSHRFSQYFRKIVVRTGKHSPRGFVLQSERLMPERIANYKIHDYICRFFGFGVDEAEDAVIDEPVNTAMKG